MEVTQIIAWIHRVMLTGLKPATDHLDCEWPPGSRRAMEAGSPFARQLLGAFAGFKSDLEARVLCHRLPRSYMHNFVCEHDLACVHLAHLTYGDFRSTAGWRTSAITHEAHHGNCVLFIGCFSLFDCFVSVIFEFKHCLKSLLRFMMSAGLFDYFRVQYEPMGRGARMEEGTKSG
jgi:hypothetical protein